MWPSPAAQEPGWQHITVVDRDGNTPEHWNQRFYDAATGRVVQKGLTQAAQMWPTPRAEMDSGRHLGKADTLHSAAKGWNTPRSRDYKGGGKDMLSTDAERFPSFRPVPPTATDGLSFSESAPTSPRRLNPAFAEWLMGLPPGWTDPLTSIEASAFAWWAMQSSPPRPHGRSSPLPLSLGGGGDESETDGAA